MSIIIFVVSKGRAYECPDMVKAFYSKLEAEQFEKSLPKGSDEYTCTEEVELQDKQDVKKD